MFGKDKKDSDINEDFVKDGGKNVTDEDFEKVNQNADKIKEKFANKKTLRRFLDDAKLLLGLVADYWKGDYRKIPFWAVGAIVFSLLYVLNPFDLVPDYIPVMGQVDDVAVMSVCLYLVEKELKKYEKWKAEIS